MSEARREDGLLLDVRKDIAVETRLHDGDNGYVFILGWKREDYPFESWVADESWDGVLSPKAQAALTAELRRREGGEAGTCQHCNHPLKPVNVCLNVGCTNGPKQARTE